MCEDYCVTWSYIKRQMNKKLNDNTPVAMCEIERAMNEAWSIFVGERTKKLVKMEQEGE